jgi:hypothetical protein
VKQAHKGAIKADRKVKDTWLDKGIYSKTRHPNYLGEGMVHVGSFLCGLPAMNGAIQVVPMPSETSIFQCPRGKLRSALLTPIRLTAQTMSRVLVSDCAFVLSRSLPLL